MKITYAYQKLHNLEPQTPVFQIELVYSKRFKNLLNINKFWNEHNKLTMSLTSAYQKFNNLEPQFPVFQIELINSKRFNNLLKINKISD